jgi:hypothetical protein
MPSRRETGYGWNGSWQHALRKNGKFWPDERAQARKAGIDQIAIDRAVEQARYGRR